MNNAEKHALKVFLTEALSGEDMHIIYPRIP
jgi:hypothetical protein